MWPALSVRHSISSKEPSTPKEPGSGTERRDTQPHVEPKEQLTYPKWAIPWTSRHGSRGQSRTGGRPESILKQP